VLSRLGVDYRMPTLPTQVKKKQQQQQQVQEVKIRQGRSVIVTGDVRFYETLEAATNKLGQDKPAAAQMIILDVPFGYKMHEGAAPCTNEWDNEHMSATEIVTALSSSVSLGLALPGHVAFIFCAKEKFGEIKTALVEKEYTVNSLIFGKVDSTRWGWRAAWDHSRLPYALSHRPHTVSLLTPTA
jgi:hypothetical protein